MNRYWFILFFLILFSVPTMADRSLGELSSIKKQLKKAQFSLKNQEIKKNNIEKNINLINSQLANYEKQIRLTNLDIKQYQNEIVSIRQQIQTTKKRIIGLKQQISDLLNYQYRNQFPNALILIMQRSNPNDKARNFEYLKYIQRSQQLSFQTLKLKEQNLSILESSQRKKLQELLVLVAKNKQLKKQAEIKKNEQIKLKQVTELAIGQDKRNIKSLQISENKLNQLIRQLARQQLLVTKKQQQVVQRKNINTAGKTSPFVQGNLTKEDLYLTEAGRAKIIDSSESLVHSTFSQHKGSLNLPVRQGTVVQYYGQKIDGIGIVKGFVIKSPKDLPVFSVGDGVVIYTGLMQDYGNTVVVMHDGTYVTVYTGLSQINVPKGRAVKANTVIGKTGIQYNGETGLYFELRENSRPINPKSWFK